MKRALVLLIMATLAGMEAIAQTSRILPWRDVNNRRTYEPMPVLCVHGIASDSVGTWSEGVKILSNHFSTVYSILGNSQLALQRAGQPGAAYVETFDYGVYGDPSIVATRGHEQTFDTIRSNAWEGVYQNGINGCITLRERIAQTRFEYRDGDGIQPSVILLCHSMGGILSHYYLCRAVEENVEPGVARLVTLGTPHYGSTFPNWQRQVSGAGGWSSVLMRPMRQASLRSYLQKGAGFLEKDVWNFERYANPPKNHPEKGGMTDMSCHVPYAGAVASFLKNPLIPYFQAQAVPGDVEYVVNSFTVPPASRQMLVNLALASVRLIDANVPFLEAFGDGIVPTFSQEGRPLPNHDPDTYHGANPDRQIPIRPVIYSGWQHIHMGEAEVEEALIGSLCGVPYRWPDPATFQWGADPNPLPAHAGDYSEMNAFRKYMPGCEAQPLQHMAHTDEPGIARLQLRFARSLMSLHPQNDLRISARDTWNITFDNTRVKQFTNAVDLVGCQVVGGNGIDFVIFSATTGTRNRSVIPFDFVHDMIAEGNEYLPAGLQVQSNCSNAPIPVVRSPTNFVVSVSNLVQRCLVMPGPAMGDPSRYQYGYFADLMLFPETSHRFVAVQAKNLAGLLTPQAERAFDVPVDSATVLGILTNINAREAMSNACHAGTEPTRWTNAVSEWLTITNAGSYPLNFFPVSIPTALADAWTGTNLVDGWFYDATNNAVVVTNMDALSTHVIASNVVWLGTATGFTNVLSGVTNFVPALTNADTLAGLPVNEAWLTEMRARLAAVVPKFRDTTTNACAPWTLASVLHAAGNTNGTWSPVPGGLLSPAHFTELASVANLLTTLDDCSCQRVTAFLCQGRIGNSADNTNDWSRGDYEADIKHTSTNNPATETHFPWFSDVTTPIRVVYDASSRQVDFRLYTNTQDYVQLYMAVRDGVFSNAPGRVANLNFRVAAGVTNAWAWLDSLQLVSGAGQTNAIGIIGPAYGPGESLLTLTGMPLQAGFTLTGNARFGWGAPRPEHSQLIFEISAKEAP